MSEAQRESLSGGLLAAVAEQPAQGSRQQAITTELIALVDRYEQPLFGFLVTMLGDRESAGDCTQDTFLRAYENLRRGKPVNVQWLYKVARNRAVDELRRRQRERVAPDPLAGTLADDGRSSAATDAVRRALARLSPDDREVLYLSEVDGFTSIEIGAMLNIRPGTVRMRLCRAHLRFRQAYEAKP